MSEDDKHKADVLMELSAAARARFEARRVVEWRMNFGIWTALLVIAAGMASREYAIPEWGRMCVVVAALLISLLHGYWNTQVSRLLEADRKLAMYWGMQVESMMGGPPTETQQTAKVPFMKRVGKLLHWPMDWGTTVAWGVTALLALMTVLAALAGGTDSTPPEPAESGLSLSFAWRRF